MELQELTRLAVAHFLIQVAITRFLKDGFQIPVIRAMEPFCLTDGGLGIATVSVLRQDEKRRDPLGCPIHGIYHSNSSHPSSISLNEVIIALRLQQLLPNSLRGPIDTFCLALPRYKRPKRVIFDTVPRNPTGKIEKTVLRERYGNGRLVEMQTTN